MADQPTYFYYAGTAKIPLELAEDSVAVMFDQPITERRLELLHAGEQPVDELGRSPTLLERNLLVHHPGLAARSPERVRAFAERLARAPSVRFVTYVFRNPANGAPLILTDEVAVRFKLDAADEQIEALNAELGAEVVEQKIYAPQQYLLRVLEPSPDRTLAVANAYHESDLVEWAEPNFVTPMQELAAGDSLEEFQWHLNNTGQDTNNLGPGVVGEDARAHDAWAIAGHKGSGNVVIAILGGGVDTEHPDLKANLIIADGCNFSDPAHPNDPSPNGDGAHETACAGVAAASGVRMSGMAPGCKILPVKIFRNGVDLNRAADAIHFAGQRAQVLSNSWFVSFSAQVEQAIKDVIANGRQGKGTIVLFATGNNNMPMVASDQARIGGVIAVGASTNVGTRAGYSSFGDDIDNPDDDLVKRRKRVSVLAPSGGTNSNFIIWKQIFLEDPPTPGHPVGSFIEDLSTENIYTTDIHGARGGNPPPNKPGFAEPAPTAKATEFDYTGRFRGTSSACPLAAGVCALMLSVNADLTSAQVKYLLEATADKIGTGQKRLDVPDALIPAGQEAKYQSATGHDIKYGFGRVDAGQAVKTAQGGALHQLVRDAAGAPQAIQDAIPVVLKRVGKTNRFVSNATIELVDARRDALQLKQDDRIFVRGGPGGFLRATFQPAGVGPLMSDEVDIEGQPV
jgi:subtilisin family serine protease